ncbi:amidase family protein [Kutzneria albida]|uniref:Amidase domain-containing protein n=1 Tax=Kutzneria albida DSM 43870 TaxID=1449976 RepID=W5WDL9_9PSEU|nr:amidase family protein [Kutzneria albida]AHH99273.1 hypothetical protein KALB_5912 [Kutzneria albida DSM 43870]
MESADLTDRCLARIAELDPAVNAVLAVDPTARAQAEAADRRRAAGRRLSPLDGIPVLVKDNIDTEGLGGSCGSRLLTAPPVRDAGVVRALRAAGAVLLGKTNLSEWANFRAAVVTEGWSGAGGQTRNPHVLSHSPWGSSSGSAAAVAAGMAPLALGTETDGSIVGPAGACGVVGCKPEPGLLPGNGICPVSPAQDSVGVFAAHVRDALSAVAVLSGGQWPPAEPGPIRFGCWHPSGMPEESVELVASAADRLRAAGNEVVPVRLELPRSLRADGLRALFAEFRPALEDYLARRPGNPGTLRELIRFNRTDPVELALFEQDLFEQCADIDERERLAAVRAGVLARAAARQVIDTVLREHGVDAVLAPSNPPAWPIDHEVGDPFPSSSSTPAALAGYPVVSVPVGCHGDLPVGMSVFGPATLAGLLPAALAAAAVGVLPAPRFLP